MDAIVRSTKWPEQPYRGLKFYRAVDAPLFRERDEDVQECGHLLLSFNLKILLLHGLSASGKSSFLRAGLLPFLAGRARSRTFLLAGGDGVIRCTFDPLSEIASALLRALDDKRIFIESTGHNGAAPVDATVGDDDEYLEASERQAIRGAIKTAMTDGRERLGAVLLEEIIKLCSVLPGKLVLVLDQAEEVLTRTASELTTYDARSGFFRFLEAIYIRNVDLRLVVTLRTEYYGRFRHELRISDDRLGERPARGGIQPFLLAPINDKAALVRVIEAPTLAKGESGALQYGFQYEEGLVARIVDDLREAFPTSPTAALQIVCASLFEGLSQQQRTITSQMYRFGGCVRGIVHSYVEKSVRRVEPGGKGEIDKWHLLLHSLVSRQGGGTLVSLAETMEELVDRAEKEGIRGDIRERIIALTQGATPLLRGEPAESPRLFSLQHDVLAIVLVRWYDEHSGELAAKAEQRRRRAERRKQLGYAALAGSVVLTIGLVAAGVVWGQLSSKSFQDHSVTVAGRGDHAARIASKSFRTALRISVANILDTAQPQDLFERITGRHIALHDKASANLRQLLAESPWFAGSFASASMDADAKRLALLTSAGMLILELPTGDKAALKPQTQFYSIDALREGQADNMPPAVGFLTGAGPAAFVNGKVYLLNSDGRIEEREFRKRLPNLKLAPWSRVEFVAGRLQVVLPNGEATVAILSLGADELRASGPIALPNPEGSSFEQPPLVRPALYSQSPDQPRRYARLGQPAPGAGDPLQDQLPIIGDALGPKVELDLNYGALDEDRVKPLRKSLALAPQETVTTERTAETFTFVGNADAVALKTHRPKFDIIDLADARPGDNGYVAAKVQTVTIDDRIAGLEFTGGQRWAYPPLAVVKIDHHWRAAWMTSNGVEVVESNEATPNKASLWPGGFLYGGEGGAKLQFSNDGNFLMLILQQRRSDPSRVRVWDLRPAWRDQFRPADGAQPAGLDTTQLQQLACRLIESDSNPEGDSTRNDVYFEVERMLFDAQQLQSMCPN